MFKPWQNTISSLSEVKARRIRRLGKRIEVAEWLDPLLPTMVWLNDLINRLPIRLAQVEYCQG